MFIGIVPGGSVDVVFHPTPTLLSGLTVRTSELLCRESAGETAPCAPGLVDERRSEMNSPSVRQRAQSRFNTLKVEPVGQDWTNC